MENQVPEPNCILRVNGCSCEECCLKLRKLFLKVDGVKSVGLDEEKKWVLIRGDADPIKLVRALNLKGREAEIMYYCSLELRDNTTPDYPAAGMKTQQPNSAEKKSGRRRRPPKCRLHGSDEEEEEEDVLYSGHVRESYVAAVPPQAEVHARKECSVPDCPFHDCYLKSLAPPPPPSAAASTMRFDNYGFQQLPPAPWWYGYGGQGMM